MPYEGGYNPHAQFDLEGSVKAGNTLGQSIGKPLEEALQYYEKRKQQGAFNDTVFDYLKNVPGAVPSDDLKRYFDASDREKSGIVLGAQFNAAKILEKQLRDQEGHPRVMVADDGTVIPQKYYVPGARQIVTAPGPTPTGPATPPAAQPPDISASASYLPTLLGDASAQPPDISASASSPPTLAAPIGPPSSPTLLGDQLQGSPSPAAGLGGYFPGRRYAGKTYLGGDPNDPANWQ